MTNRKLLRVLVALDCDDPDLRVLGALPRILGEGNLELTGLYVEDEDLRRAASLPGLQEVSLTGAVQRLEVERVERDTRHQGRLIRRSFEALARQLQLRYTFTSVQGRHVEELTRAAQTCDFVLVSRPRRPSGLRPRAGVQLRPLVEQPKTVLFVNEPWSSGSTVVTLYAPGGDAQSGASEAALEVAARYAAADGLELVVAVPASASAPAPAARESSRVVTIEHWNESSIAELCRQADARLLVLPASAELDWQTLLPRLIDRVPCSLLRLA